MQRQFRSPGINGILLLSLAVLIIFAVIPAQGYRVEITTLQYPASIASQSVSPALSLRGLEGTGTFNAK